MFLTWLAKIQLIGQSNGPGFMDLRFIRAGPGLNFSGPGAGSGKNMRSYQPGRAGPGRAGPGVEDTGNEDDMVDSSLNSCSNLT